VDARFVGVSELSQAPPVAVVIDVMRAFTVTAWAFALGAEKIVLAESLEDALAHKARHPDWLTVKDGPPMPGFDLANSPGSLRSINLFRQTLVQKTTAGTVGVLAARGASLLLCAGFVVAEATARLLQARQVNDVTFVITGDGGRADEDLACAEYIAGMTNGTVTDPAGFIRRGAQSGAAADLLEGARRGYRGIHPEDAALCLEADRFPFAMVARPEDSRMTLRPCPVT
jgi:2-phosphosulfolactate phosphatase